jgi:outer membrane protein OmpA-like peptidoglycan-associated protein
VNADGTKGVQDPKLALLCNQVNLRVPGKNWRQAAQDWANLVSQGQFPDPAAIRWYAEQAESALHEWNTTAPAATSESQRLAIPAVPFETNSAVIAESDSALVRRTFEALREHLIRNPVDTVTIQGSADPRGGTSSQNVALASNRAANLFEAILRYDDGTLAANLGRIRTSARVTTSGAVADAVQSAVADLQGEPLTISIARQAARGGEYVKARSGGFYSESASAGPDTRLFGPEAAQPSSIANAPASAVRSGSLTLAIVDVVGEQAAEQVQMFLVEEVTRGICGRSVAEVTRTIREYRDLLPSTCALFGDTANRKIFRPTVSGLRAAVREDLASMFPKLVSGALTSNLAQAGLNEQAEALFALGLVQYVVTVGQGEDALGALGRLPERLGPLVSDDALLTQVQKTDVWIALAQTAPFIRLYRDARATIRGGVDAQDLRDQVLTLTIRALLVNASDQATKTRLWATVPTLRIEEVLRAVPAVSDATTRLEGAYEAVRQAWGAPAEQKLQLVGNVLVGSTDLFLALLPELLSEDRIARYRALVTPVRGLTLSLANRDYRNALVQGLVVAANVNPRNTDCRLPNGLFCPDVNAFEAPYTRLASFASDFANAQDQRGMNDALQSFVSEGGGYRSKRHGNSRSFFTVNAYMGLAGAREWGYETGSEPNYQGAFYLPVGVEWVHRWGRRRAMFPSASVFLQVVDLGSIAAARYKDDRQVEQPNPELLDILAPGVFGVLPLGRTPVSMGFGVSVAPRAQVVGETAAGNEKISGALRGSIFVAVDVPLFP